MLELTRDWNLAIAVLRVMFDRKCGELKELLSTANAVLVGVVLNQSLATLVADRKIEPLEHYWITRVLASIIFHLDWEHCPNVRADTRLGC